MVQFFALFVFGKRLNYLDIEILLFVFFIDEFGNSKLLKISCAYRESLHKEGAT